MLILYVNHKSLINCLVVLRKDNNKARVDYMYNGSLCGSVAMIAMMIMAMIIIIHTRTLLWHMKI